jgi:hypothetical protein
MHYSILLFSNIAQKNYNFYYKDFVQATTYVATKLQKIIVDRSHKKNNAAILFTHRLFQRVDQVLS